MLGRAMVHARHEAEPRPEEAHQNVPVAATDLCDSGPTFSTPGVLRVVVAAALEVMVQRIQ